MRLLCRRPCQEAGVLLVETMFSLALVGVILLAVLAVFMSGLASIRQGGRAVAASNLAAEQLDRIRALDFASVPSGRTFDGRKDDARDGAFPPVPYPSRRVDRQDYRLMVVTCPLPGTGSRIVRVDVTVFWMDQDAVGYGEGSAAFRERSLTFTSVVTYGNQ